MKKAIAAVCVLTVVFAMGIFIGTKMGPGDRMEAAEASAYEMQLALPRYKIYAVDIDKLGPSIMVMDIGRSAENPDMVARIEVGMGGENYPVYWDKDKGTHVYHWNEEASLEDIIAKLEEQG